MPSQNDLDEVSDDKIGLDRSTINHQGQIRLPEQLDPAQHVKVRPKHSSHHQVLESIKDHSHGAAAKLKRTFHAGKRSDLETSKESPILARPSEESDSRLVTETPKSEKHTLRDLVHNPVETIKSELSCHGSQELASNIAAKEIPHGQDVDILNAETALDNAKTEGERIVAEHNFSRLLRERQSTYVRWTLDRHVNRVRVLPTVSRRPRSDFMHQKPNGEVVFDWKAYSQHLLLSYAHRYGGQYIGYGSSPPGPSKETIAPNIERLIVASAPFQEFLMTTRRVYRWENPPETIKYLLVYVVLWYLNLLLPGTITAFIYYVVEHNIYGNSISNLREDIKHTEDVHKTAMSLTEFIEKRGDDKWADDVVQALGPWLMVQLADLANFFESMRNFYEWRKRGRTFAVLVVLSIAVLVTAFTPQWLLVKTFTFSLGTMFFGIFPIGTNFPEYRLLASAPKRLFWNIPTHAEWSIQYIQAEAIRYKNLLSTADASSGFAESRVFGSYSAHHNGMGGRLIIRSTSVRFVSSIGHHTHWILPYDLVNKIEKQDQVVAKSIVKMKPEAGKGMKIVSRAGEEFALEKMEERDQAFSQILGFSPITWQVVW